MERLERTDEKAVWRDGRVVALLMAASLTTMANATISPALPGLQRLFADDPNAMLLTRLLVPAPSLSVALVAPFVGLLVDRFGRRPLLPAASFSSPLRDVRGSFCQAFPRSSQAASRSGSPWPSS